MLSFELLVLIVLSILFVMFAFSCCFSCCLCCFYCCYSAVVFVAQLFLFLQLLFLSIFVTYSFTCVASAVSS